MRPQVTASDLLTEYLKVNFASKPLRESGSEDIPDIIVIGEMKAVEEDFRTGERTATLALVLKAIRGRNDELLLDASFRKSRPCGEDGYAALAREFSLSLSDIYRDFVQRLDPILSRMADETREETKG